ncbi:MAG: hypothetical protein ACKV1O_06975 [Saprospiraceae bacterium]
MTRIILEVPHDKDLDLLLALLDRLDIRIINKASEKDQPASKKDDETFILKGLPARKDFDSYVHDFDLSREDRVLPGREN